MRWDRYKRRIWERLTTVHADVRVAGFLRALSIVGIVGGFSGFMIGLNPVVAMLVIQQYDPGGDVLVRVGIGGLLVYVVSAAYFYATAPVLVDDGLIRY
jgi:hypothetical protein